MPDNQDLVLVGVVNRRKDLEIALNKRWYRMPVKYAPKRKANFLALYQTRVFGKEGKSINYYAPIKYSSPISEKLLKRNKIKAFNEYLLMEDGHCRYRLDFAVFCEKGKIDVECDNEKWHRLSSQRVKDRRRDLYLGEHGWTVLRFEGENIMNNPNYCIKVLKEAIRKLGGLSFAQERK